MTRLQIFFITISVAFFSAELFAQDAKYPVVQHFGGIYEIPGSINPDSEKEYKIVIDLLSFQQNKEEVNPGLNNVARMMNLHGLGGIDPENLHVAVVAHGGATEAILDHKSYREKTGFDNPNIELIKELKKAGAEVYVCGQSLLARNYATGDVNPDVKIGLSMLTVVTSHMHNGYELLVFD